MRPEARWFPPGSDTAAPAQEALPAWQPPPQSRPVEPHPSGPHQVDTAPPPDYGSPAGYATDPRSGYHAEQPYWPDQAHSGAHPGAHSGQYADQTQSGSHPVDQSGPYPVDRTPSGRYLVGQQAQQAGPHPYQAPLNQQLNQPSQQTAQSPQPGQPQPGQPQPGQPQPGQSQPAQSPQPGQPAQHPSTTHDLSSAQLLRQKRRPPQTGWRRAVYVSTAHAVNFGESPSDRMRRELINRINQPLRGCYKIAMLSLKGGVGKTTTTTALGSTFASLRGDRVIAVDANPDRGTLSQKIPLETTPRVRPLRADAQRIRRYSDVRARASQGASRLEVLASEQDPAVSEAFSESDYRRTVNLLEHFYNIVLTDCGTGLMHSAMKGVLELADSLVVVSSGSIDGARSASATLDWLDAHGYRLLVARSVAVINSVRPKAGKVDLNKVADHFAARCRAVCRIPFDPHLEEGAELELDQLTEATRLALLELAATVGDDFPHAMNRARTYR